MDIKLINYDIQNHNLYHFIGIKVDKLWYSDTQFIPLLCCIQHYNLYHFMDIKVDKLP